MPRSYGRADPSWRSLARQYWPQYAVTALIFALMELVDPLQPVPRFIYHESDAEYWRYSRVRKRALGRTLLGRRTPATRRLRLGHDC